MFDPAEWAKKTKVIGMKYAVIKTKHHERFNMFKSEYTDNNIMNTPYGKDIVAPSNNFIPGTPQMNIEEVYKTVKEYNHEISCKQ